ncbi:hypothetical protein [Burkholderia lata]|uniref:hypothetical protein n=1 Tax=Burkholderia lata (strain ATCC 17760 / DSM 23089 / LMG 22485 / NCIMB 9086 / R18194 / 383) TaxID=482957 RepID=UPI001584076F|nr:hypothetical protein [Burkholderia lata]
MTISRRDCIHRLAWGLLKKNDDVNDIAPCAGMGVVSQSIALLVPIVHLVIKEGVAMMDGFLRCGEVRFVEKQPDGTHLAAGISIGQRLENVRAVDDPAHDDVFASHRPSHAKSHSVTM